MRRCHGSAMVTRQHCTRPLSHQNACCCRQQQTCQRSSWIRPCWLQFMSLSRLSTFCPARHSTWLRQWINFVLSLYLQMAQYCVESALQRPTSPGSKTSDSAHTSARSCATNAGSSISRIRLANVPCARSSIMNHRKSQLKNTALCSR